LTGLPAGTPVFTGAADIACTQIGTGTLEADIMAITLSTSAQIIMRVPDTHVGVAGQVTFHPSAAAAAMYAMGSVFTGGLGVQWGYELLFDRDSMNAGDYERLDRLSERMKQIPCGSGGLLFLPFLVGSSTPYFDPRDRAAWIGLTHHRDKALLLHSIMEGIAFNIRENVEAFAAMGQVPRRIYLGGGGSRNPVWRQMIADVLGREMVLLQTSDASALGAAAIAGVGAGLFDSLESISRELVREGERLDSDGERHRRYNVLYEKYRKVYRSLHEYYTELDSELLGE
jgi:xylulokinase